MNPSQTKSMRHRQKKSEGRRRHRMQKEAAPESAIYLPFDLIKEVLPFLPVKSLIRLKCVSKPFNSFISDPTFIKMHFDRSSQNATNVTFVHTNMDSLNIYVSFTFVRMLENPPTIVTLTMNSPYYQLKFKDRDCRNVIGSCNGLVCLFNDSDTSWFRVWNPATRTISDKLGFCSGYRGFHLNCTFGYDNSQDTYKVVCFIPWTKIVRVFSLKKNVWRDIQDSPVTHLSYQKRKFVHFSDNVNWLVISDYYGDYYYDNYKDISIEQFVIISLDLRSETHTKLLPPQGFNEVPFVMPNLSVLNDCLCFSHDFKRTHFIIWQMKEFGVAESWTQFLKISYHNLQTPEFGLFPLCLSEKNDTILLTNDHEREAILYTWRNNRARRINKPPGFIYDDGKHYVESLFSYC